jgi:hypothetical protein
MRRWGDLDSNKWVAPRPYCNARATAFDKVLTGSKPVVCAPPEKSDQRWKASLLGFHCPDTGTAAAAEIPNPKYRCAEIPKTKTQAPKKLQIPNSKEEAPASVGI